MQMMIIIEFHLPLPSLSRVQIAFKTFQQQQNARIGEIAHTSISPSSASFGKGDDDDDDADDNVDDDEIYLSLDGRVRRGD